ncbi:MAG TPA: hypothetical protein VH120_18870 [Gemmataceae bacterium]|nr:hypothetical protein [Gemmataceae bacterium]
MLGRIRRRSRPVPPFRQRRQAQAATPDCARDKHKAAGRRLGRGAEHFFAEDMKRENETGEDPYRELARQTLTMAPVVESATSDAEARLF